METFPSQRQSEGSLGNLDTSQRKRQSAARQTLPLPDSLLYLESLVHKVLSCQITIIFAIVLSLSHALCLCDLRTHIEKRDFVTHCLVVILLN
jgi:hypothetical protein